MAGSHSQRMYCLRVGVGRDAAWRRALCKVSSSTPWWTGGYPSQVLEAVQETLHESVIGNRKIRDGAGVRFPLSARKCGRRGLPQ